MGDSTILYAGVFCFSLILIAFVLTAREFNKMGEADNSGKRKSRVAHTT